MLENTSFLGRDRALADLLEAMERQRLTTLWGAAGVGKTRLLRRACAETTARGRVTVVEVMDLVPARDRAALVAAVAQALGLSLAACGEEEAIPAVGDALARAGEMLLALDGLEHLLPHADVIAAWLRRAPALRVLCTSRSPLGLAEERPLELEPLSVSSAVALFEDRVRALTGRPLAADEEAPAERIARRAGGLPLAVELAAARSAALGVGAAAADLEGAVPQELDGPARMMAVVRWAHERLDERERLALGDVACCADGVGFDVAAAVVGAPDGAEAMHGLRRSSLLWTRHGRHGELRCGVYSSVRDFLATGAPPPAAAMDRHVRVVDAWAAPLAARVRDEDPAALDELLADAANLELALSRARDEAHGATLALAAVALAPRRGSRDAHDATIAHGLRAARHAGLVEVELELLERHAALSAAVGHTRRALEASEAAAALASGLADPARRAWTRAQRAGLRAELGDSERALEDANAAISAAPEGSAALALALDRRGAILILQGQARGLDDLGRAAHLAAHGAPRWLRLQTLLDLAQALRRRGAVDAAAQRLLEASTLVSPGDDRLRARLGFEEAALARADGRTDDAAALLADARVAAEACGAPALRSVGHRLAAELALDRGDPRLALDEAERACALAARVQAQEPALGARRVLARACHANGDVAGARRALTDAAGSATAVGPLAAGDAALLRSLVGGEPDGSAPQMKLEVRAACQALLPLGGAPAARALAVQAILDPEHADRSALLAAEHGTLDAETRALLDVAAGDTPLDAPFALARLALRLRRAPLRREMLVGSDGRYYELDGRRISLARQRSLRLIFLALVDEAERRPGHGLAQPEVLARGWPGEKMRADSGATRVYTSIRRLRKGGLEGVLVTRDDGYLIDPLVSVRRAAPL